MFSTKKLNKRLKRKGCHPEISTAEEWFKLPRKERESKGFYILPYALTMDFKDPFGGEWKKFYKRIKKDYPVQYFFREVTVSWLRYTWRYKIRRSYHFLKRLIWPHHADIRAKIPRTEWRDISTLIEDVNFQFILSFADEARNSCVSWESDETRKEVYKWLMETEQFLLRELPILESKIFRADYPDTKDWIKDQDNLSKKKEEILIQMVKYRDYLWT